MPESLEYTELPDDVQHEVAYQCSQSKGTNVCRMCGTEYATMKDTPCPAKIFGVMCRMFKDITEGMKHLDRRIAQLEKKNGQG